MSSEGNQRRGAVFLHANQVEETRKSDSPSLTVGKPPGQHSFVKSNISIRSKPSTPMNAKTNSSVSKINKRYSVENAGPSAQLASVERRAKTTVPDPDDEGTDKLSRLPSEPSQTTNNRRRTSISIRRGSTVGQDFNRGRRMSTSGRRKSVAASFGGPTGGMAEYRRRGSVQPHAPPKKKKLEEPSLTNKQIEAFREVFDLFDTNGGGSIDADELHSALASVDIYISHKEIEDVLSQIDVDGNGEIDFQEFLTLMTNTEKFLEMFAAQNDEQPKEDAGREHLLFDALTQFMKKSALKQMDELVGYFHKKYKRMNAPHVVSHYAAGARLIGLTEKQLQEHLDRIRQSNRDNNYHSPYAEPLYILHSVPKTARRTVTKKEKPTDSDLPKVRTGKIRLIINKHRSRESLHKEQEEQEDEKKVVESTHSKLNSSVIHNPKTLTAGGELHTPRLGWVSHRAKSIAERLIFLGKKHTALTMEDLPKIRKNIQHATKAFNKEMSDAQAQETLKYWRKLKPNHINSKILQTRFQKVFCAYSSAVRYGYTCQLKEIPYKV